MNKGKLCSVLVIILLTAVFVDAASNLIVSIPQNFKQIRLGDEVGASIGLSDFEPGRKDVVLEYWLTHTGEDYEKISDKKETIAVESRAEFVRNLIVPVQEENGKYTYHVKISYLNGTSVDGEDTFNVVNILDKNQIYYMIGIFSFLILVGIIFFKPRLSMYYKKLKIRNAIIRTIRKKNLSE